jgi:hypothetical protein
VLNAWQSTSSVATPTSKGVLVKPRRAWGMDSAAGATLVQAALAANFNYGALLNDSRPACDLAIYGLSLWQSTATVTVELGFLFGPLPGATLVSAGNPLISGGPVPPGSLFKLQSGSVFGTFLLELAGIGGWFFNLDDSPMIILPPKYSLILKTHDLNVSSNYSVIWGKK